MMSRLGAQQLIEDLNKLLSKLEDMFEKQPFVFDQHVHDIFGGLTTAADRLADEVNNDAIKAEINILTKKLKAMKK